MNSTPASCRPIEDLKIISVFQPLYSVHEKKYIGAEALSRGYYKGEFLNASQLFQLPANEQENFYLNKRCIIESLENLKLQTNFDQYTIFLNIDSSLMDYDFFEKEDFFLDLSSRVPPQKIVIELIENRVKDFNRLFRFVQQCRKRGYLIALDDVGSGYSSLERIVKIKPDIIKIDRELVNGISEEFHKREVCRALTELAHNIGALSLAEGVETINDALECQNIGADIMQGFYFSKPQESIMPLDISAGKISLLVETWNFSASERNKNLQDNLTRAKLQANKIHSIIFKGRQIDWDNILLERVNAMPDIECAYILDNNGKQISLSAMRPNQEYKKHFMFTPARPGADHSQKYYFLRRSPQQKWYISDPYISRATGNICRTVSMYFETMTGEAHLLCLDIGNQII